MPGESARRVRLRIEGRVQGVSFRASLAARASSLDVGGWVRNAPDGSVEAELEGAPDRVEALVAWCRIGPRGARVDAVEANDAAPAGERDFAVLPDRRW